MNEFWIQCFSCCFEENQNKKRRIRIDRNMIGTPSNFQHTAHLGSESNNLSMHIQNLKQSLGSKGGYETSIPVNVQMKVIDVRN